MVITCSQFLHQSGDCVYTSFRNRKSGIDQQQGLIRESLIVFEQQLAKLIRPEAIHLLTSSNPALPAQIIEEVQAVLLFLAVAF